VSYFLGIDGGATKTCCVIGDERTVFGTGVSGPANPVRVGVESCRDTLLAAIVRACEVVQIAPSQVQSTCIGLAGAARPEISAPLRDLLRQTLQGQIEIVGDNQIALHAALRDAPGVIVISGTGSIAFARDAEGRLTRAGGWGHAISDEGSGTWIGRDAIAAIFREADEKKPPTPLLDEILHAWNLPTRDALVVAVNASPAPDFASLVPVISLAASKGDLLAASVLSRAGSELAAIARIAIAHLFKPGAAVPVAMSGGVFRHCAQVRDAFAEQLTLHWPAVVIAPEIADPALGALNLARRAAGISHDA
jgi:glucosamine kinase